jgi:hypothetical protein
MGFVSYNTLAGGGKYRWWDPSSELREIYKQYDETGELKKMDAAKARADKLGPRFAKAHAAAKAAATGAAVRSGAMTAAKVLGPIGVVAASEKAAGATPDQERAMMQASMRDPNSFYNTKGPGSVKRPAYNGQSYVSSLMGVKNPRRK